MRDTNHMFIGDEYHFRLGIYLNAKRFVEEHNRRNTFKVGLNNLAHLTETEYKILQGYKKPKSIITTEHLRSTKANPPDSIDWRTKGVVNQVKDQGQCGSCWAFSTVQAQESQWAMHNNELLVLSEQQLVDCVKDCYGCDGGYPGYAMTWVKLFEHGMFTLEKDYPYEAVQGTCRFNKEKGVTKIKTHKSGSKNEEELKAEVAEYGVYSIVIDSTPYDFQLYKSGIYQSVVCSDIHLTHAVGLVGYGTENSVDFWIVRNSWSDQWGENGYIRIRRNYHNMCGVSAEARIPIVK